MLWPEGTRTRTESEGLVLYVRICTLTLFNMSPFLIHRDAGESLVVSLYRSALDMAQVIRFRNFCSRSSFVLHFNVTGLIMYASYPFYLHLDSLLPCVLPNPTYPFPSTTTHRIVARFFFAFLPILWDTLGQKCLEFLESTSMGVP